MDRCALGAPLVGMDEVVEEVVGEAAPWELCKENYVPLRSGRVVGGATVPQQAAEASAPPVTSIATDTPDGTTAETNALSEEQRFDRVILHKNRPDPAS